MASEAEASCVSRGRLDFVISVADLQQVFQRVCVCVCTCGGLVSLKKGRPPPHCNTLQTHTDFF